MRCDEIVLLLSEHIQGELSRAEEKKVDEHLQGCASCREERQALLSLSRVLLENPPPLPQSMQFQMMPDRLWAELQASKDKERPSWIGRWLKILGLVTAAPLFLFLVWPDRPSPEETPLPSPTAENLALPEVEDEPLVFLASDPEELLDEIDEETADRISANLFASSPDPEESFFVGSDAGDYLDELEEMTPAELERLDTLLRAARKKG